MEFNPDIKKRIEEAKKLINTVDNLSEKEQEILFSKMVDRILDNKEIVVLKGITPSENLVNLNDNSDENLQEMYHRLKPKTSLDTIMLLSYYFYKINVHFSVGDLLEKYGFLLISPPSNPSDLVNKNRQKGFIMLKGKSQEKNNLFSITRSGLSYVESGYKEAK